MRKTTGLWLLLLLFLPASVRAEGPPKKVLQAEEILLKELDDFNGQTLAQIRQSLGTPKLESDWQIEGQRQPVLDYKWGKKGVLSLYSNKDHVVYASWRLSR